MSVRTGDSQHSHQSNSETGERHLLPEIQHQREYVHPCVAISLHNMIQDWFREGSKYSQNFKDFSQKKTFSDRFEPSLTFNVPGQGLSN